MPSQPFPWMKYPVGSINRDMLGLSDSAEATYHRLARVLWETGPLPEAELAARGRSGWADVSHLFKYRTEAGEVSLPWVEEARESIQKRSESAKKGGQARAANAERKLSKRSSKRSTDALANAIANAEPTLNRLENRDIKRNSKEKGPEELFDFFGITSEEAYEANAALHPLNPDFSAYLESISTWSASTQTKRTRAGWLSTFRTFVYRDRDAGTVKQPPASKRRVPLDLKPPPIFDALG